MIGTRQADPFYLESPSGDFYTSPFLLAFASVPPKLPPSGKSLIGEKSSSGHLIGARWYDPELAIFMSVDPAGQYANPYSYGPGSPVNGSDPTGMWWNPFDPDDWRSAGREANEYTEKAWNKAFNDECHYETNSSCRGNIQEKVEQSGAVGQLMQSCHLGNESACSVLKDIGGDGSGYGSTGAAHSLARGLALYIFENGSHTVGINLSLGGGKAAPTIQYDDKTIPLGVYDLSSSKGSIGTDKSGVGWADKFNMSIDYVGALSEAGRVIDGEMDGARVASVFTDADVASDAYSRSIYGVSGKTIGMTDNDLDAFRHQFAGSRVASKWGVGMARTAGGFYEATHSGSSKSHIMDRGNNEIGIRSSFRGMTSSQTYNSVSRNISNGAWININGRLVLDGGVPNYDCLGY